MNNNTRGYAGGTRSTTAQVQQHADGSQSFSRDASTSTQSSLGNTQVDRSANGSINADGTKSYNSSTDIQSSRGDASVETTASQGTVTTTVNSARGENTYSAGDGEIQNKPSSSSQSSNTARSTKQSGNKFSQWNAEQIQAGNSALNQSWGQLEQQATGRSTQRAGESFQRSNHSGNTGNRNIDASRSQQPSFSPPSGNRGGAPSRSGGGRRR